VDAHVVHAVNPMLRACIRYQLLSVHSHSPQLHWTRSRANLQQHHSLWRCNRSSATGPARPCYSPVARWSDIGTESTRDRGQARHAGSVGGCGPTWAGCARHGRISRHACRHDTVAGVRCVRPLLSQGVSPTAPLRSRVRAEGVDRVTAHRSICRDPSRWPRGNGSVYPGVPD